MTDSSLLSLPDGLPAPEDDGAAAHLPGLVLPALPLVSTDGRRVDLSQVSGRSVVYIYPMTGRPDEALPAGWDAIPGARGCTPQSCSFRDHHPELKSLGTRVYGLSTQDTAWQREAATRLHLPFPLLSDADLAFTRALRLPTFEVEGKTLLKRLTLIASRGRIETVFYPVFPPDKNAEEVLAWLRQQASGTSSAVSSPEGASV
jgi:peroxiredoxin